MFMLTKLSQRLPAGVDACIQGHDCQHVCVPHGDSYLCGCHRGFVLNADRKSCARKLGFLPRLTVTFAQILSNQSDEICVCDDPGFTCRFQADRIPCRDQSKNRKLLPPSVSLQVCTHALRDTSANIFVLTVTSRTTADVTRATC